MSTPKLPPAPADGERVRIPLADLADYLLAHGLETVYGDADVAGEPWQPTLYLRLRPQFPPPAAPATEEAGNG